MCSFILCQSLTDLIVVTLQCVSVADNTSDSLLLLIIIKRKEEEEGKSCFLNTYHDPDIELRSSLGLYHLILPILI